MKYYVTLPGGDEIEAQVTRDANGRASVSIDGETFDVDAVRVPGALNLRLNDKVVELSLEGSLPHVGVAVGKHRFYADVESERMRALGAMGSATASGDGIVASPMPGRVVRVLVEVGQEVEAGVAVVVVEAMKMENELAAGRAGVIKSVFAKAGDTVDGGTKLVEIG